MKIVFDSNVLFSAYTARGFCFELVDWCLENHRVRLSAEILEELETSLKKKSKASNSAIQEALEALRAQGRLDVPTEVEKGTTRDSGDLHVLGLALAVQADLLVTGDQDLLVLKKFKGIPILSPREAWIELRANR